ncbi:MAG TPA: glycosyltransferase, partial [Bacteroidales bacterium]|nr:glycosyltransferase [Bacteroidales bacterium]
NFSVIIAADGDVLRFLRKEFPHITSFRLPDVNIRYSKKHVFLKIFLQTPKIFLHRFIEHFKLKSMLKRHPVDLIISDNRFGVWHKKTYNVFISHQLKLKLPKSISFLSFVYPIFLQRFLNPFDECWIPDFATKQNFSGELSHHISNSTPIKYVGVLSRFYRYLSTKKIEKRYDLLFILSGLEPQRTIFENIILNQINGNKYRVAIVRGVEQKEKLKNNADVFDIVSAEPLYNLIKQSNWVICRAGYSSIMDLYVAQAQAILVPTPGQTEQEYLADYLKQKKYFYSVSQQNFNLDKSLEQAGDFAPPVYNDENNRLEEQINSLKLKLQ